MSLHIKKHVMQEIWQLKLSFRVIFRTTKMNALSWKEKTNVTYAEYLPMAASSTVISEQILSYVITSEHSLL